MTQWFGLQSNHTFQLFSSSHWAVLIIAVLGIIFMVSSYKRWPAYPNLFKLLKWGLFSLLVVSEVSYQLWTITNDIWSFNQHMPLHLCGIASLIAILSLVFKKDILIQLSFFFGVVPAFMALVTPDLPYGYEHYRFWKFFVHHTVISWACIFVALARPEIITFRSMLKSFLLLAVYALLMGFVINPLTNANYLYLTQTPGASTPLDLLGSGIWYYINLNLTAFILFYIQFLLWKVFIRPGNHSFSKT